MSSNSHGSHTFVEPENEYGSFAVPLRVPHLRPRRSAHASTHANASETTQIFSPISLHHSQQQHTVDQSLHHHQHHHHQHQQHQQQHLHQLHNQNQQQQQIQSSQNLSHVHQQQHHQQQIHLQQSPPSNRTQDGAARLANSSLHQAEHRPHGGNATSGTAEVAYRAVTEASTRWLKPHEIYAILTLHYDLGFKLSRAPPFRPASGSIYLFNKIQVKYFRRDGYCWKKKKDGKATRENHERLKIEGEFKLSCAYNYGEDKPYLQRRMYWLLEKQDPPIVLVHYIDVSAIPGVQERFKVNYPVRNDTQSEVASASFSASPSLYSSLSVAPEERSNAKRPRDEAYEDLATPYDAGSHQEDTPDVSCLDSHAKVGNSHQDEATIDFFEEPQYMSLMTNEYPAISRDNTNASDDQGVDLTESSSHVHQTREQTQNSHYSSTSAHHITATLHTARSSYEPSGSHSPLYIQEPVHPMIIDFAPSWVYVESDTKIIIVTSMIPDSASVHVVFNGVAVPANVLSSTSLRCTTPSFTDPGTVQMSIRLGNSVPTEFPIISESLPVFLMVRSKMTSFSNQRTPTLRPYRPHENGPMMMPSDRAMQTNLTLRLKMTLQHHHTTRRLPDSLLELHTRTSKYLLLSLIGELCSIRDSKRVILWQDDLGLTLLHYASILRAPSALQFCIRKVEQVDILDIHGMTALHWAAASGSKESVSLLLLKGSNPNRRDLSGATPTNLAQLHGHSEIIPLLAAAARNFVEGQTVGITNRIHIHGAILHAGASPSDRVRAYVAPRSVLDAVLKIQHWYRNRSSKRIADVHYYLHHTSPEYQAVAEMDLFKPS